LLYKAYKNSIGFNVYNTIMTKIIHPEDTLNIYYRVSENTKDIEHISVSGEEDDISKLDNLQNVQMIQWSPDKKSHNNETFKIDINGFGTQKVRITDFIRVVDDFEIYESTEDLRDNYNNETEAAHIETDTVFDGEKALRIEGDGTRAGGNIVSLEEDNTLSYYPQQGDIFRCAVKCTHSNDGPRYGFGFYGTGTQDGYHVVADAQNNLLRFEKDGNTLNSISMEIPLNEWILTEVEWGDPTITVKYIKDNKIIDAISEDDTDYGEYRGINFVNNNQYGSSGDSTTQYFDGYKVVGQI